MFMVSVYQKFHILASLSFLFPFFKKIKDYLAFKKHTKMVETTEVAKNYRLSIGRDTNWSTEELTVFHITAIYDALITSQIRIDEVESRLTKIDNGTETNDTSTKRHRLQRIIHKLKDTEMESLS